MINQIAVNLINKGTYAIPNTSDIVQITGLNSYAHSITSQGGCESCTIKFDVSPSRAIDYLDAILKHIRVYDNFGYQIWCGFVNQVTIDFGSSTTSVGLNDYASRFVLYANGTVSGTLFDANVAQTYGEKLKIVKLDVSTLSAAQTTTTLTRYLAINGAPTVVSKTTSETKSRQQCTITIEGLGYYQIASWKFTGATALAGTNTDTAAAIVSRINSVLNPNAWFTVGNTLASTGVIDANTNSWEAYSNYAQVIDDLAKGGTSTGQVLAYGVMPDAQFELSVSNINNNNINYVKSLGSSIIYSTAGGVVPPTQVLPDNNLSIIELKPIYFQYSLTYPGLQYIDRVSLQISNTGYQLNLEPATLYDAGNDLARLVRKDKFKTKNK